MGDFLKPGGGEDTTLLHVCSGKLEHINLKQVVSVICDLHWQNREQVTRHKCLILPVQ